MSNSGRPEAILEIGVDDEGRLFIVPEKTSFDYIYREAMDVHWDRSKRRLHSPKPREWSYLNWFHQIVDAAGEQGVALELRPSTIWTNISDATKTEILRTKV